MTCECDGLGYCAPLTQATATVKGFTANGRTIPLCTACVVDVVRDGIDQGLPLVIEPLPRPA